MSTPPASRAGGLAVERLPAWQRARWQRIVEAAGRVLAEQDYDDIQIRDVAEAADVARATLYRYFSSKEHLYACVLHEWSTAGRDDPESPSQGPAEERVRGYIHTVIGALERRPQFFRALIILQNASDPNAKKLMADIGEGSLARLTGLFDVLGPGRAEDTAMMLWAIIHTLTLRALFGSGEMSDVHRIADRFIDSIASDLR
ncbi:TetR/AcrR family transcriptional regulator [Actinomadura rugatobispora]|uniref:TetR/AcrR family transcriptional regulator n=1 Tax=Actinomadura rugatobispora TaxID=1994 RepID=A0ABW0ZTH6_9ACTN|nr:hypothetical protein GCM10010200_096720 [Actinomadura rugatobispora]